MSNHKGFTLIEIVTVLLISSIMVAVAGMGIVKVVEGMVFTQKNASTHLKAQVALTRIEKELHIATAIAATSTTNQLTFTNNKSGGSSTYTFCRNALNNSYVDIATGTSCSNGDHFIDNVTALTFAYRALDGSTAASPDIAKVIDVTFTLLGAGGTASTFSTRIAPRML